MNIAVFSGIIFFAVIEIRAGRSKYPDAEAAFQALLIHDNYSDPSTTTEDLYNVSENEAKYGKQVVVPLTVPVKSKTDLELANYIRSNIGQLKIRTYSLNPLKASLKANIIKKVFLIVDMTSKTEWKLNFHCLSEIPQAPHLVLDIPETATKEEIERQYRKLALKAHEDKIPKDQRTEETKKKWEELTAARDTMIANLENPKK